MDLSGFMSLINNIGGTLNTGDLSNLTNLDNISSTISNNPNALYEMLQSMDSSFTATYGSTDSESILNGEGGVTISGLPESPSQETYQALSEMESAYATEQQDYLNGVNDEINKQKELVFSSFHYQYDADGNPLKDDDGNVILYEGGETAGQKETRLTWENNQKKELYSAQNTETLAFNQESEAKLKAAQEAYNADPTNQDAAANYAAVYAEIQADQEALTRKQTKEQIAVNTAGLPADVNALLASSSGTATSAKDQVTVPDAVNSLSAVDTSGNVLSSTTDEEGNTTSTTNKGVTIVTAADGTVTSTDADGKTTVTATDGTVTTTNADGSKTVTDPNGRVTSTDADGKVTVTYKGTTSTTTTDGTTTSTAADGTITVTQADGKTSVYNTDGSTRVTESDGTITATDVNGNVTVTKPDGTTSYTAAPQVEAEIPEGTKMLSELVDEKWAGYDQLIADQKTEEAASPEYQEVNNYNQAVMAFVAAQKTQYTSADGTSAIMDQETLQALISGGMTLETGTDSVTYDATTIQNLINNTDVFSGYNTSGLDLGSVEISNTGTTKTTAANTNAEAEAEGEGEQGENAG